jgi:hypothetical protein
MIQINSKYRKYINSIFIFGPMTFIMAFIGVMRNYGLHEGWFLKIIGTWLTMFPIAFLCGLIIIPAGNRLTANINFSDSGTTLQTRRDEMLQSIENEN